MNSLDTNILLYAANPDCKEHLCARQTLERLFADPDNLMISHQILFEYYSGLRNPHIVSHPLSASQAAAKIQWLHEKTGSGFCSYEPKFWPQVLTLLSDDRFPFRRTFDAILAATLLGNGVTTFYTRNDKDYRGFGFKKVINPID